MINCRRSRRCYMVLLFISWLGASEISVASQLGIIGDSISTAMDANDQCIGVANCLAQIREDRDYSFAGGLRAWSLRGQLAASGIDGVVDASRNGARWDDALGQAMQVTQSANVSHVSIQLGGNDICRDKGEMLPDLAQIAAQIDATLLHLSQGLRSGATVLVSEVPDVVQLYSLVRDRPHFLFQSCQALWDLDANRLNDSVVQSLCGTVLPGNLNCNSAVGLAVARRLVAELFESTVNGVFGSEFSCGKVLNSASTNVDRMAARSFNQELNRLLADQVARYDSPTGVRFVLGTGVFDRRFEPADVSLLDCFHPSRSGQQNLADSIFRSIEAGRSATLLSDGFELQAN